MSNILNDFCVNVADDIAKITPKTPRSPLAYLFNRTCNSFFLFPATRKEVNIIINSLDPSKSVGPNSLTLKLLKVIGYFVSPLLAHPLNQSIQSDIFPD